LDAERKATTIERNTVRRGGRQAQKTKEKISQDDGTFINV